jgi:hypothetical protein
MSDLIAAFTTQTTSFASQKDAVMKDYLQGNCLPSQTAWLIVALIKDHTQAGSTERITAIRDLEDFIGLQHSSKNRGLDITMSIGNINALKLAINGLKPQSDEAQSQTLLSDLGMALA